MIDSNFPRAAGAQLNERAVAWCLHFARIGPAGGIALAALYQVACAPFLTPLAPSLRQFIAEGRGPGLGFVVGLLLMGCVLHFVLRAAAAQTSKRAAGWLGLGAGSVLALGLYALGERLFQDKITIDFLLFAREQSSPLSLLRLSPFVSLNFILLGAALLLLIREGHKAAVRSAQVLAATCLVLDLFALSGYLYGEQPLHSTWFFLPLSAGILCARPRQGLMRHFNATSSGGTVLRLFPLLALLPEVIDYLEWLGERRQLFTERDGQMIQSATSVLLVTATVWWVARRLHWKDLAQSTTEDELRRSEERYRNLIEDSPSAIIVKGRRRIEFANPAARNLVGAEEPDQMLRRPLAAFLPPGARSIFEAGVCKVVDEGAEFERMEQRILRLDGVERDVEISISPVEFNGQRLAQVLARDITDQKRTTEALQASEERFRFTFEQAAVGMTIASLEGQFLRVNNKFSAITGYSPAELGMLTVFGITHPDDVTLSLPLVQRLLAGEIPDYSLEKRFVRKNGASVWVQVTVGLVRHPDHSPHYFIGLIEDISERRNLENKLRHVQKMEAIGQLAAGIAHDFNNMLTAIQGYVSLLELESDLRPDAREFLQDITRATQRASSLTRQLLIFGRREIMQPAPHDLNQLIRDIARMLQRLLGESVRLHLPLQPEPLRIHVDAGMIDQVLVNLAVNARDAMAGNGELVIETSTRVVSAEEVKHDAEAQVGCYAHLRVSDTGSGIPPEILPRIFEPFFTTKAVGKGTGLGLATTYSIIKQHRGWITAGNGKGGGATFDIFLPLIEHPSDDAEKPPMPRLPQGEKPGGLLVEKAPAVGAMPRAG